MKASEPLVAKLSTCTEWSMTRSTGISGLIFLGSPPGRRIAARMAARSTTHGTPVKSCNKTRPARLEGNFDVALRLAMAAFQPARFFTSSSVTCA